MNLAYLRKKYHLREEHDDAGAPGGAAVVDDPKAGGEDPGGKGGAGQDGTDDGKTAALEAEARKMGWTPKEDFKGDPSKWRPADEFVERGKSMLPIVQAKMRKQETEIAELKQTVKDFQDHLTKTEKNAYDKAMRDLRQERADAIAAGDAEGFDKADQRIEELKADAQAKAEKRQKADDGKDPVYEEWAGRNKAILDDPDMSEYAEFVGQSLRNKGEKSTGAEFLDLVADKVKARFPEKFTNPRREAATPAVEGRANGSRRSGTNYADMPADARAACDRMARSFANESDAKAFKQQYVANYFEGA